MPTEPLRGMGGPLAQANPEALCTPEHGRWPRVCGEDGRGWLCDGAQDENGDGLLLLGTVSKCWLISRRLGVFVLCWLALGVFDRFLKSCLARAGCFASLRVALVWGRALCVCCLFVVYLSPWSIESINVTMLKYAILFVALFGKP
jgi:hypothetical protein